MPSAVIGASPAAPAASNCAGHAHARQLHWARTRASQPSGRTPAIDVVRLITRYPPARLPTQSTRHRTREPRYHAAPSDRRITTRRRLAGGVRQTGGQRPSVRGAISTPVRGAISARVPPSSPSRHTRSTQKPQRTLLRAHNTQTHPSQYMRRGTRARARRSTLRSAINFVTNLFESRDTNPPPAGVPPALQAATHAARAAFGRPCRCARERERPVRMLQVHTRHPLPRLPQLRARREARRPPRATRLALAIGTCERAATPVLLTACALLSRCRQLQLRAVGLDGHRALDISATTGRHSIDSSVTMIRPPSRAAQSLCL